MIYNNNKNINDGFSYFTPQMVYSDIFKKEYECVFNITSSFYKKDFFKKIEKAFGAEFNKKSTYTYLNKNKDIVYDEIIYTFAGIDTMIGIRYHWDNDLPSILYEEEEGEGEPIDVKGEVQCSILVLTTNQQVEFVKKKLRKIISCKTIKPKTERALNIICFNNQDGIYIKEFDVNKIDMSIEDNYNDSFKEVSDLIIKRLNTKKDNGIVLLHSEPGCGKTSYLRYLTNKVTNKRLIYLPPDMTRRLSDPDFMSFLMSYPDSILIIEDAENCLQRRDMMDNQSVSNLLNNSDGLLGDALRIQIVCTFNCSVEQIDPALMRPGRLIAEYKFEKLDINKTRNLIKKLYGEESEHYKNASAAMTLAQIYSLNKERFTTQKASQTIGFKRGY